MNFKNRKSILSFGAHPDDIELGCGGTEYKLIQEGHEVTHVYVTSGEAGSQTIAKSNLAQIREDEARSSATVLGVKDVIFLKCPDGFTQFDEKTRINVINLIRKIQPEIVFVHGACDLFPDHKLVHNLVMGAVQAAAGPWFQEAEGEPWVVKHILGYEVWHPMQAYQYASNISAEISVKLAALACFKSQMGPTHYDEAFKGLARYRAVMSWQGEYAEVFEVIKTQVF